MKRISFVFFLLLIVSFVSAQSVTEILYPRYIQGVGSGVSSQDRKVPYACRMRINSLMPNTTYRYYARFVFDPVDATNGTGNFIIVDQADNFIRVTSASLGVAGSYGEFTTDASGNYTGWFIVEATSDPLFQPGTELYWRIMLNDGAGGSTVVQRITAASFVTVLNWGTTQTTNGFVNGSAFWGATNAAFIPKNLLMLYDNIAGTGRPVTSTFIEADGTANTIANGYVPFYQTLINEINNRWATIIPNNLANGINNISQYALSSGNLISSCTSPNGVFPSINQTGVAGTTDTKNANWGLTVNFNSTVPRNVNCTPGTGCNITLSNTVTNVSCNGGNNGAVNLTVTGATAPVTYSWSNGATTEDISALAAGTFIVTVTDANNCTVTATISITQPPAIGANAIATAATCGSANGSINLTVSGGSVPYTYIWSTGATTEDINNLPAGAYNVTITDANGCTATASAIVSSPGGPAATVTVINATCGNANGSVNLTVTGGAGPYTYLWSNGATTEDIMNLVAGNYSVTVTDANGCTATINATVTASGAPSITITGTTHILCFSQSTGAINITVTGGASPYTYLWSNGATTEDINALPAGSYGITVTDANNCSATANVTITEPAQLTASSLAPPITVVGGTTTVTVTATGGTPPYTGTGTFIRNAGTYTFIVTDANGCTASTVITLAEPGCAIALSTVATSVSCNGGSNGAIDLTVTGATGALTYSWSNGSTTEDITGLTAGTYIVTVTDAANCAATATVTVSQPAQLLVSSSALPVTTVGGTTTVTVTATGGTPPYTGTGTFIRNAGTYTFTVTDANGCTGSTIITLTDPICGITLATSATHVSCNGDSNGMIDLTVSGATGTITYNWNNGSTTEDITALPAGVYTVIVTDAANCTATTTVVVNQPTQLIATETHTSITCLSGNSTVTVNATGGTAPYTGAGSFTQAAGTQLYTVTDANGCTSTVSVTVTVPSALTVTETHTSIACSGGNSTVTINATGGTAPYTGTGSFTQAAGTQSYTVTDANGCTASISVTITQPQPLSATETHTAITCFGGTSTVTISATGGTSPYTGTGTFTQSVSSQVYTVTDAGECTSTITVNVPQPASSLVVSSVAGTIPYYGGNTRVTVTATGGAPPYAGTGIFIVNAGAYSFTVTDSNGCTATTTGAIDQPAAPTSLVVGVNPNPAAGYVIITMSSNVDGPVQIRVMDAKGRLMLVKQNVGLNIPVRIGETWSAGVYFLEAIQGQQRKTVKVIKVN